MLACSQYGETVGGYVAERSDLYGAREPVVLFLNNKKKLIRKRGRTRKVYGGRWRAARGAGRNRPHALAIVLLNLHGRLPIYCFVGSAASLLMLLPLLPLLPRLRCRRCCCPSSSARYMWRCFSVAVTPAAATATIPLLPLLLLAL